MTKNKIGDNEFSEVIELITRSRQKAIQAVNAELINLYWNIGAYISNRISNAIWGEKKIDDLAEFIRNNYSELKSFSKRGIYRMKQFYESYYHAEVIIPKISKAEQSTDNQSNTIVSAVRTQLVEMDIRDTVLAKVSWTHHRSIFARCNDIKEMQFYLNLTINERFSTRELDRQILSSAYERSLSGKLQVSPSLKSMPADLLNRFKDRYVFEFLDLEPDHKEKDLQKELIKKIKKMILELGKDFLFMEEEFKIRVGNRDFSIDLLFYHRGLQCLIAVDLKRGRFEPEHLGKLNFYLEALDRDVKHENENPSIGMILCPNKDSEVVEYALNRCLSPAMVAEYKMQLPDKIMLQERIRTIISGE